MAENIHESSRFSKRCVCFGCSKKYYIKGFNKDHYDGERKLSFFKFPKEKERRSKWLKFIRRPDIEQMWETGTVSEAVLLKRYHICSIHFNGDQFMNPIIKKSLRHDAVPSLYNTYAPQDCAVKKIIMNTSEKDSSSTKALVHKQRLCEDDSRTMYSASAAYSVVHISEKAAVSMQSTSNKNNSRLISSKKKLMWQKRMAEIYHLKNEMKARTRKKKESNKQKYISGAKPNKTLTSNQNSLKTSEMSVYCAAINCSNRDGKYTRISGISFHSFPEDAILRLLWCQKVKRATKKGNLWTPPAGSQPVLCSTHFRVDQFERSANPRRLVPGAVPTIFDFSSKLDEYQLYRRKRKFSYSLPVASEEDENILERSASPMDLNDEMSNEEESNNLFQSESELGPSSDEHSYRLTLDTVDNDDEKSSERSSSPLVLEDEMSNEQESNNLFQSKSCLMSNTNLPSPRTTVQNVCSTFPCKHYVELIEEKAKNHKLRRTNEALELRIEDLAQRLEDIESSLVKTEHTEECSNVKVEMEVLE